MSLTNHNWVNKKNDDHILPSLGAEDHINSFDCFCDPIYKGKDPVTFRRVFTHKYKNTHEGIRLMEQNKIKYCAYCSKKITTSFATVPTTDSDYKSRTYMVHNACEIEFLKQQGSLDIINIEKEKKYA